MELYQLRYFTELARQRSFTQAAKRLDLATPALSVQIQKLEEELGVTLFIRGQRQTVLTPSGEILFERAQALLNMADSVKQSVAEVSELRAGRLTVAFIAALGTYWLPEVFRGFRREFPCVNLVLQEEDSLGVAALVEDSSAELGFLEFPINDQLFQVEQVWEEPILAVLAHEHPLAGDKSLALAQLAQDAFVVQRGTSHQQTLDACRRAGFEPRLACECSEKETAISLAQAGLGVMLLPQLAASVPREKLAVVPVREPKLVRQLGLISRRGKELSAAAKAFVEIVKKARFSRPAAAERPGLEGRITVEPQAVTGTREPGAGPRPAEALLTPLRFLDRSAQVHAENPAVKCREKTFSYARFAQRVNQLASALRRAGLEPGGRVAFLCANTPPFLEAHFGVPLAGGVLVPINLRLAAGDIAYILNHSGAKFVFVDAEFSAAVRPVLSNLAGSRKVVDIVDESAGKPIGEVTYEAFLETGSVKPVPRQVCDEEELISLNYTSGTTGKPKGVMIVHRGAYLNALGNIIELGLTSATKFLWTLPMFHCNGWGFAWAVTAIGGTHVCLRKPVPAAVWELIEREAITHLCGSPSMMAQFLAHPARPKTLRAPLTVFVGGAPPSVASIQQWQELGARFMHGYGLTETYGGCVICEPQTRWEKLPPQPRAQMLARQGVPFVIGDTLRVVDEKLRDVPRDGQSVGEVIMRGATVAKGYYQEPEATARDFHGGWFHSGDLAVVHPDGYLELQDRRRDVIIVDGEKVASTEVEQALYEHSAVAEAAVVGVPHAQRGEAPKAFVVLREGAQVRPRELLAFCRARLAKFQCPLAIEFLPRLPKTASGKIQKYLLREKEWAGQKKRIHGV